MCTRGLFSVKEKGKVKYGIQVKNIAQLAQTNYNKKLENLPHHSFLCVGHAQ